MAGRNKGFAYLVQFVHFDSRPKSRDKTKPALPHGYMILTTAWSAHRALEFAMGMGGAEIRDADIGTVSITRANSPRELMALLDWEVKKPDG